MFFESCQNPRVEIDNLKILQKQLLNIRTGGNGPRKKFSRKNQVRIFNGSRKMSDFEDFIGFFKITGKCHIGCIFYYSDVVEKTKLPQGTSKFISLLLLYAHADHRNRLIFRKYDKITILCTKSVAHRLEKQFVTYILVEH